MKSKKRVLIWVLSAVLLLGGLSACGGEGGGSAGSGEQTAQKTTVAAAPEVNSKAVVTGTPAPEPTQETAGDMTVHFLDVGQGLSVLVQSQGRNLIYDGGGRGASSFTVSYLQQQGVTDIQYLISSHYDEDHVAGLVGCLNAFHVEQVIGADYVQDTKIYESFMKGVEAQGLSVQHPAVGTEFSFGSGKFTILAPSSISGDDNGNSVVIKLENGSNSFIFTGDASAESEAAMCGSGLDLECDVLSVSHHGSATATSWEFLQAAVPELAVVSCGTDNSYGHPHRDTMDRLESMEIQVYRTDKQGTVTAVSDGTTIKWNQAPCNDYSPGDESDQGTQPEEQSQQGAGEPPAQPEAQAAPPEAAPQPEVTEAPDQTVMVWISATGSKYHNKPDCGNMNPDKAAQMSEADAQASGYEPCKKCF